MTSKDYLSLSKSICQTCGTLNSIEGPDIYSFNKNVYTLYGCDNNFFVDFDNTKYIPYNDDYHTTILKRASIASSAKGRRQGRAKIRNATTLPKVSTRKSATTAFTLRKPVTSVIMKPANM